MGPLRRTRRSADRLSAKAISSPSPRIVREVNDLLGRAR
jgi:hypothetical protein